MIVMSQRRCCLHLNYGHGLIRYMFLSFFHCASACMIMQVSPDVVQFSLSVSDYQSSILPINSVPAPDLRHHSGGGMIFTFYKSMGYDIGASLVEEDMIELAGDLMKKAEAKGVKLVLPSDVVVADKFAEDANTAVAAVDSISGDWRGLDIGPDTLDTFAKEIADAGTIVW